MRKGEQEENTDRSNEGKHVAGDVSFRESGPSVCKEVLPLAFESFIVGTISECCIILGNQILGQVCF